MPVLTLLTTSMCASGQESGGTKSLSRFEVVSIHPVPPDSASGFAAPAGTEFRVRGTELSVLVQMAFGVNSNQIVMPDWAHGRKFDVAATTGSSVPLTYLQMQPLLQAMLVERFGMAFHRETRSVQGYALIPAKGGLKLTLAPPGTANRGSGRPGAIDVPTTTMRSFAGMLTQLLQRPVEDKTEAPGTYAVQLRYAPDDEANSAFPSITTALREQLGITLLSTKVPVETVVLDHLEKTPTDN